MREAFLDLLGLPNNASEEEIKKKYRELALKLHPDVNPSPNAQEQFRLIQKAYDFLTNEEKQLHMMYNQYKTAKAPDKTNEGAEEMSFEEKRAQMRERAKYYSKEAAKEAEEIELGVFNMLTQKVPWAIVRTLAGFSVAFGLIILIDFFVPVQSNSKELKFRIHKELFHKNTFIFTDGDKIDVSEEVYLAAAKGDMVSREYSGILHEFLGFKITKPKGDEKLIDSSFSLFTIYPLFALLFMLPGILFFYQANEVKFYLLYFAACVAYPGLILHYVLREDKLYYVYRFLFE